MGEPTVGGSSAPAPPQRVGTLPSVSWRLWNLKGPEWRTAGWLGALLLGGLLLLTFHGGGGTGAGAATPRVPTAQPATGDPLQADEGVLEANLTQALDAIAGAGPVTVRVHLEEGPVTEFATNTQTTDSTSHQTSQGGGDQTTTQHSESSQLATPTTGGGPPVQSVEAPTITGVLVVAAGAGDATVRAELTAAVQAATAVPLYRIVVVPAAG